MKHLKYFFSIVIIGLLLSCETEEIIIDETRPVTEEPAEDDDPEVNIPNPNGDDGGGTPVIPTDPDEADSNLDEINITIAQQSITRNDLVIGINITNVDIIQGVLSFSVFANGQSTNINFSSNVFRGTNNINQNIDIRDLGIENGQSLQIVVTSPNNEFSFTNPGTTARISTVVPVPLTIPTENDEENPTIITSPVITNVEDPIATATTLSLTANVDPNESEVSEIIARIREDLPNNDSNTLEFGRQVFPVSANEATTINTIFENLPEGRNYLLEFLVPGSSTPILAEPFSTRTQRVIVDEFEIQDITIVQATAKIQLDSYYENDRSLDIQISNDGVILPFTFNVLALANTEDQEFELTLRDLSDQNDQDLVVSLIDATREIPEERILATAQLPTPLQRITGNIVINNIQENSVDLNITYDSNFTLSHPARVRMQQGNVTLGPIAPSELETLLASTEVSTSIRSTAVGTSVFSAGEVDVDFFYINSENAEVLINTATFTIDPEDIPEFNIFGVDVDGDSIGTNGFTVEYFSENERSDAQDVVFRLLSGTNQITEQTESIPTSPRTARTQVFNNLEIFNGQTLTLETRADDVVIDRRSVQLLATSDPATGNPTATNGGISSDSFSFQVIDVDMVSSDGFTINYSAENTGTNRVEVTFRILPIDPQAGVVPQERSVNITTSPESQRMANIRGLSQWANRQVQLQTIINEAIVDSRLINLSN